MSDSEIPDYWMLPVVSNGRIMNDLPCPHCGGTGRIREDSDIGWAFKADRKAAEIEQQAIAQAVGISATYLSDLEHGRRHWSPGMIIACRGALERLKRIASKEGEGDKH